MKKRILLMAALFFFLGFMVDSELRTALAQPSIVGTWLFDMSGADKGGAVITFSTGTITGYGFGLFLGRVGIIGTYTIDGKGVIKGFFTEPDDGSFTGKVDKKLTKISLKVLGGLNLKGIRLPPAGPNIPEDWVVKASRLKGAFDPFTIQPIPGEENRRFYSFHGSGTFQDIETFTIVVTGTFFLSSKNVAYGSYEAVIEGQGTETGTLTGKVNLSSNKFSLKVTSNEGDNTTLKGVAK